MATAATTTAVIPLRIGIDFGGVLSNYDKHNRSEEDEHQSVEINMPKALESLIKLKEAGHQLYLISYCGERRAVETKRSLLRILPRKDFFNGLYFVQRTSHKADVCRYLGCDIMIDDKLKILNNIQRLLPTITLIWFNTIDNDESSNMIKVESWDDIIQIIERKLIHEITRHKPDPRVSLEEKIHKI